MNKPMATRKYRACRCLAFTHVHTANFTERCRERRKLDRFTDTTQNTTKDKAA